MCGIVIQRPVQYWYKMTIKDADIETKSEYEYNY